MSSCCWHSISTRLNVYTYLIAAVLDLLFVLVPLCLCAQNVMPSHFVVGSGRAQSGACRSFVCKTIWSAMVSNGRKLWWQIHLGLALCCNLRHPPVNAGTHQVDWTLKLLWGDCGHSSTCTRISPEPRLPTTGRAKERWPLVPSKTNTKLHSFPGRPGCSSFSKARITRLIYSRHFVSTICTSWFHLESLHVCRMRGAQHTNEASACDASHPPTAGCKVDSTCFLPLRTVCSCQLCWTHKLTLAEFIITTCWMLNASIAVHHQKSSLWHTAGPSRKTW